MDNKEKAGEIATETLKENHPYTSNFIYTGALKMAEFKDNLFKQILNSVNHYAFSDFEEMKKWILERIEKNQV